MSAIQDDVTKAAQLSVFDFETRIQSGEFDDYPEGTGAREVLLGLFQRAIMAERERCAALVESGAGGYFKRNAGMARVIREGTEAIAAAIRKGEA